jgi:hypothetical protein
LKVQIESAERSILLQNHEPVALVLLEIFRVALAGEMLYTVLLNLLFILPQ